MASAIPMLLACAKLQHPFSFHEKRGLDALHRMVTIGDDGFVWEIEQVSREYYVRAAQREDV